MTDHEYKWAPNLPHMNVRRFIAERLRKEPPSHDLDRIACEFLGLDLSKLESVPAVTRDLDAAVAAIPDGWWWHLSHLEAQVTPTVNVPGAPVSNGTMYDFYGRPVGYSAMCWGRGELPAALCEALLKARYDLPAAFVVEASAKAHNDYRFRMQSYRQKTVTAQRAKPKRQWWRALLPQF